MATTRRSEKPELELLPEELYGTIRGPLRSLNDDSDRINPAMQGGVFEQMYHRNVYHIAALYLLTCWAVAAVAPLLLTEFHLPLWVGGIAAAMAVLGFPIVMFFAWSKELTPAGLKWVEDVKPDESLGFQVRAQLNRAIVAVLGVGLVSLAIAKTLYPAGESGREAARASNRIATLDKAPDAAASATPVAQPAPAISIAVLAFTDLDAARDLGYLANGLAEELVPVLGTLPQLAVTSGESSFRRFKSADVNAMSVGSALGVQYLVGGSVRRVDDRARVSVELIDARDGTRRWTETFDRDVGSAFQLRADIAAGLAKALAIPVGADDLHVRRVVRNSEALELYLRGRQAFARGDRSSDEQAADLYRQALDLEPQSATIETAVAELNLAMAQRGYLAPQVGVERARQAAEAAKSLDINVARAHQVLAWIHSRYDLDWHAAARDLDLAKSVDPHDPKVLADVGLMNLAYGQFDGAAQNLQAALALDPLDADIVLDLGLAQFWGGHLPQAEASLRQAVQLDPSLKSAHFYLGKILLAGGDQQAALAEEKNESDARHRLAGMAEVLYAMGRKSDSDALLAQLKPLASAQWGSGLAAVYASRNEADEAFQWLDRAYAQKDADLQIVRGNPSFQNVSGDPRFLEFQRKINLPG